MPGWADRPNFSFEGEYAYTEDYVRIYKLYIYKISPRLKESDLVAYSRKHYGAVKSCEFSRSVRNTCIIWFDNAQDAANMLRRIQHHIKNGNFSVKAAFSWLQPHHEHAMKPLKLDSINNNNNDCGLGSSASGGRVRPVAVSGPGSGGGLQTNACNDFNKTDRTEDTSIVNVNQSSILDLNDYCLMHLMSFLPLSDAIQFARTCPRFLETFRDQVSYKYKTFSLTKCDGLTLWTIRDLFLFCGEYIEVIVGSLEYLPDYFCILDFIGHHCSNLKKIYLKNNRLNARALKKLLPQNSKVEELHLEDCSLDNEALGICQRLKHLKTLALPRNFEVTGKHLHKFCKIEELRLNMCHYIHGTAFISAMKKMRNLRALDIRNCSRLMNSQVYNAIVKYCRKLEHLRISCDSSGFDVITSLPCLKELFIEASSSLSLRSEFFRKLSEYQSENLELLRIHITDAINLESATLIGNMKKLKRLYLTKNTAIDDNILCEFAKLTNLEDLQLKKCTNFTKRGLINLVNSCKNLKWLNLEHCQQIDAETIEKIISVLKEQIDNAERRSKLILMVRCDDIPEALKNDIATKHGESLLQIVYNKNDSFFFANVPLVQSFDGISIYSDFYEIAEIGLDIFPFNRTGELDDFDDALFYDSDEDNDFYFPGILDHEVDDVWEYFDE